MKLLLTGATGFVGRTLLLEAWKCGRYSQIVAVVRDRAKLESQLRAEGVDPAAIETVEWNAPLPPDVDHAVHCAAVLFARDREAYFRVNVDDALRILSALSPRARILAFSSQSAGGPTPRGRDARTARDPDAPVTWYGESKREMEERLLELRPDAMIWRPPMILGPRDAATLPLFRMARCRLRLKPGLRPKFYSWIGVRDLIRSVLSALSAPNWAGGSVLGACAPSVIRDLDLIHTAAQLSGRPGVLLRLPGPLVGLASAIVDGVPPLRRAVPSLTRDRAREIVFDRWVIDGREFRERFSDGRFESLREVLEETRDWYVRAGMLP